MSTSKFPNDTGSGAASALHEAVEQHRAGRTEEAERLYRAFLRDQPRNPEANHNLGVLALQRAQPKAALPHLKLALEADPAQGQYWLSYAEALVEAGHTRVARQILEQGQRRGLQGNQVAALARRIAGLLAPIQWQSDPAAAEVSAAVALFNQGRYPELERAARELTRRFPGNGFGWKVLGVALKQLGRAEEALEALRETAALMSHDAEAHFNLGVMLKELGRPEEAETSYRRALELRPDFAEAHGNLSVVLDELGRLAEAERQYRSILADAPKHPEANHNLGVLALQRGAPEAALACLKVALEEDPGEGRYWLSYVEALIRCGQAGAARQVLEQGRQRGLRGAEVESLAAMLDRQEGAAPRTAPASAASEASAHFDLAGRLREQGRVAEAEASLRRALDLDPDFADAHCNLGVLLRAQGRLAEAEACLRRALALRPDFAPALNNLGHVLRNLRRQPEAEHALRRAIELSPDLVDAHFNLAAVLRDQNRLPQAEACYRRVIEMKPDLAEAHADLGAALQEQGRLPEALASCRRALELKPGLVAANDAVLFCLNYDPDKSAEEIFAEYREYDARAGLPCRSTWRAHANPRGGDRRLRVGYVSPDFRRHAASHFLEPLLSHHDKEVVEVFAYAELRRDDEVTARYRACAEHWIPTLGLSDDALAERIRADGIDILVDLAGHTSGNRLGVFARKPAPLSVSWLGYGYTTGLSAIDYLLTDEICAPAGSEGLYAEAPWRLATPGYVYRPAADMGPVSALPALARGHVTFGTLTRAVRINHRTIRVWSEILKRVAGARLVIDSNNFLEAAMREALAARFAAQGITADRLEIGYRSPPWDVLRGMDIGLDCFPHNSGTTLFESLYMGVPYVTLAGRPTVGRLGSTILHGLGHAEWIAATEADYIDKAVALAGDLGALARVRAGLRAEMQASALMDEPGFARKVEAAYREMWKKWSEDTP